MSDKPIALITGGAQGLGRACAEALAEDGYRIVLTDIQEAVSEVAAEISSDAVGLVCDMGNDNAVSEMFDQVEAEVGPPAALVNNAGIALPGDFLSYSMEDFRKVMDVNLFGVFTATQRAANTMIANKIKGAIVNMSSINAVVSIPAVPAYCASKGGVMQLTKAASIALAPHGIRVNAVGPGSIDTEMLATINSNPDAMKMVMSRTPAGRLGTTREIANIVAFLVSDKASYITGETIYADGGRLGMNYVV